MVKVIAVVLIVVSVSVMAYVAISSYDLSRLSLNPHSSATYATSAYSPQNNYSVYIVADNCMVNVIPSPNNTLQATLEVSDSFFVKAYAHIEVTERSGVYTLNLITSHGFATSARAYVYLPGQISANSLSVTVRDGEIDVDAPTNISSIAIQTTNGNTNLQGNHIYDATMQTTNGNAFISVATFHSIVSNTVNGNGEIRLSTPIHSGSLAMSTINGNMKCYVNPTSNLSITASTVNGQVTISGLTYTAYLLTSRQFAGTVNSGGTVINLSTVNGNIGIMNI